MMKSLPQEKEINRLYLIKWYKKEYRGLLNKTL